MPVRRFGVLRLLVSQMSLILLLPDDCDDNDDVANSPNDGDNAIEDEEGALNTGEKDELLLYIAGGGITGGGRVCHSLKYSGIKK